MNWRFDNPRCLLHGNNLLTLPLQSCLMSRADLDRVREWTISKLSACQGPLSAGHPYIKLLASVDGVLARMNSDMPPRDCSASLVNKLDGCRFRLLAHTGMPGWAAMDWLFSGKPAQAGRG